MRCLKIVLSKYKELLKDKKKMKLNHTKILITTIIAIGLKNFIKNIALIIIKIKKNKKILTLHPPLLKIVHQIWAAVILVKEIIIEEVVVNITLRRIIKKIEEVGIIKIIGKRDYIEMIIKIKNTNMNKRSPLKIKDKKKNMLLINMINMMINIEIKMIREKNNVKTKDLIGKMWRDKIQDWKNNLKTITNLMTININMSEMINMISIKKRNMILRLIITKIQGIMAEIRIEITWLTKKKIIREDNK